MGIIEFWKSHGRRHEIGVYEDPKTEATLRTALAEPTAPGEDESYHRLMGVIADDLRYRQPIRHRNWAWIPTTSVAVAGMVLAVIAYDAGVQHGKENAAALYAKQNKTITQPIDGKVPWNVYVPLRDAKPTAPRPKLDVREVPGNPSSSADNVILAWLPLEGLSRDQRDFVLVASKAADKGNWEGAAKALVQMADQDPNADASISALHAAAEIQTKRLKNNAAALGLYQRELQACDEQLAATDDPDRQRLLTEWRHRAELGVSLLSEAQTGDEPPPTTE